ncbi:hypothetical protein R3P38DRAFT_3170856 [Favolaschia claudopus]|uniref:Uncharacterized protein n=1 Tax=Favolaschia claudopus TaxID=2862362 RepID=A0AAW0DKZ4_9AGAR
MLPPLPHSNYLRPLKWPHTPTNSSTVQPSSPRNCLQQPHTDCADLLGQARALPPGSLLQRCKLLFPFVSLFHRVLECGHFQWLDPELWAAERRKARGPGYGAPPDLSLDNPPSPSFTLDPALVYLPSQYLPPPPSQLLALPPSQLYPPPPDVL